MCLHPQPQEHARPRSHGSRSPCSGPALAAWLPPARRLLDSAAFLVNPANQNALGVRLLADRGNGSPIFGYDPSGAPQERCRKR